MSEATNPLNAITGEPKQPLEETAPQPEPTNGGTYSIEEIERRGDEIYERDVLPNVKPEDKGKFVAIDVVSGAFEIDANNMVVEDRLYARVPDAQGWLVRIGYPAVYRIGFPKGWM